MEWPRPCSCRASERGYAFNFEQSDSSVYLRSVPFATKVRRSNIIYSITSSTRPSSARGRIILAVAGAAAISKNAQCCICALFAAVRRYYTYGRVLGQGSS